MKNIKLVVTGLFLLSTSVLCFEILATRISSVIFVNNYAFIILSLSIFGIGCGGIYSYYNIKTSDINRILKITAIVLFAAALSLIVFILAVTELNAITNPFLYFFFLIIPFFLAGIAYAQIFKIFVTNSFRMYAADLIGAAVGSLISLIVISYLGASNAVLFISIIVFSSAILFIFHQIKKSILYITIVVITLAISLLSYNGSLNIFKPIPIGNFPEKDYHHVYEDPNIISEIIDSRWSSYGRADLVQYSNQNVVKQLFVDGAAGSQMYKFSGNIDKENSLLINLLLRHSISIPFFFLNEYEKNNMLIIGPGGGKEVLIGLFSHVDRITGVEINPDFVNIVKDYKYFNGGIYTDFPNVEILVKEGRHYIKQSKNNYDLIVMSLPSTEQLQSIDAFAMNENYLLTVEALKDYLEILTEEGRLIFTLHNQWELIRLIVTAITAFEELGININNALNHFAIVELEHAPTIVIKKSAFTKDEVLNWQNTIANLPNELPGVTFLPYSWEKLKGTRVNQFLAEIYSNKSSLKELINKHPFDISPCVDDSPYFYKVNKGIPGDYLWLLIGITFLNLLIVVIPYSMVKGRIKKNEIKSVQLPLMIFICIGLGFMILEISLFQKLILYLGSPTISLSILLSSVLVGMGIGSYWGGKLFGENHYKRLYVISVMIVFYGVLLFLILPAILNELLAFGLAFRAAAASLLILPLGFLLGIPFPTALQLLRHSNLEKYIPWMYGINGTMSVLSSILTVILSMLLGFTYTFFVGLSFYLLVFIFLKQKVFSIDFRNRNI